MVTPRLRSKIRKYFYHVSFVKYFYQLVYQKLTKKLSYIILTYTLIHKFEYYLSQLKF